MSFTKPLWLTYDYSYLLDNIGSKVRVTLKEGVSLDAGFYNFDPKTHSLFVVQRFPDEANEAEKVKVLVLLEHAVERFEVIEEKYPLSPDLLSSLISEEASKYELGSSEMERRKSILMKHLKESRVPAVTTPEDFTVHIMDSAHVEPPYISTSVRCDNDVVKQRIQKILSFIEY